ncbi:hypothetical protein MnBA_39580 [Marinobacterium sp. BA1]
MWLADWMVRFWVRSKESLEKAEAEKILSCHGMSAHIYMPGFGVDDQHLRQALEKMAYTGRIVLDDDGHVVGRVMPKLVKGSTGARLRLVVDNTK